MDIIIIFLKNKIVIVGEVGEKLKTFVHCWEECKMVHLSVENILAVLQKVKHRNIK
jgi:hypothetical protein